ncbi:envelope stress response protein PspG [Klebsiella pneumoniae]|nr:envelope stress response protein PspG [Klebsiella pneumoniae]QJK73085.1 hypothetical protein HJX21_24990 [Klebsiella pneumoniae]WII30653.1 envelope stress response protein PspG [Klebsiella pneumoniae]HBZ7752454.1 envelope stress response protein PspG [Klebsiella pneumoniae]
MLELLFVIGFFVMLLVTGVSLLGIIAAIVVATALKSPNGNAFRDNNRWRY